MNIKLVPPSVEELGRRFDHHAPTEPAIGEAHHTVREVLLEAATSMTELCPPSRELLNAIEALELAMFWANAGIARYQQVGPGGESA